MLPKSHGIMLGLILLTMTFHPVVSKCCPSYYGGLGTKASRFCEDGTTGPCCGYGKCNLFCCACKGDLCRNDGIGRWKPGSKWLFPGVSKSIF